ncbi:MAG: hypothetical protein ACOY9J_03370 [Pseudomonadota bacterium]
MSIRDASAEAFHGLEHESGQLHDFERHVRQNGPCTRAMAGQALNYPANVYSARINKLVAEGVLIELPEKAPCDVTGCRVGWLAHRDRVTLKQLGLEHCDECARDSGVYCHQKICCAARYVLFVGNTPEMTIEAMVARYGHPKDRLLMVMGAIKRERMRRLIDSKKSANEGVA